jgi:hypothetical protein
LSDADFQIGGNWEFRLRYECGMFSNVFAKLHFCPTIKWADFHIGGNIGNLGFAMNKQN